MPRWLRRLLLAFGVVTLLGAGAAVVGAVWIMSILPHPLPSLDLLESFAPREGSQIYDADDAFLTELHAERQIFVPREMLKPKFAIPFHYGTFPVLKGTPAEYQRALGQTASQVFPIGPGDKLTF